MADAPEAGARPVVVAQIERWLATQPSEFGDGEKLFWASARSCDVDDGDEESDGEWQPVLSIEQLAVRVSTAIDPDSNVCFASGMPHFYGRESMVWAVNLWHDEELVGDVRRAGYPYTNYDGFSALTAAQIAATWIRFGDVLDGHELRHIPDSTT